MKSGCVEVGSVQRALGSAGVRLGWVIDVGWADGCLGGKRSGWDRVGSGCVEMGVMTGRGGSGMGSGCVRLGSGWGWG